MNDERDKSSAEDAFPTSVNSQVITDLTGETSTRTNLGAVPSSYGADGGTTDDVEPTDGEPRKDS